MWIIILFDLPVKTKKQRREANLFRNLLKKEGFVMWQYSVYIRNVKSKKTIQNFEKVTQQETPKGGKVSILTILDKQYNEIVHFFGKKKEKPKPTQKNKVQVF